MQRRPLTIERERRSRRSPYCLLIAYVIACLAHAAVAQELPPVVAGVLDEARADCVALENGSLQIAAEALHALDLTGDGHKDWLVDHSGLTCSSAASLFCGTGGCTVSLVVADNVTETLAKGWRVMTMDPLQVVLLQVHGSECGGTNLRPCVEALVWDPEPGAFVSVAAAGG